MKRNNKNKKCRACGVHIHNNIGYCTSCAKRLGYKIGGGEDYSDIFNATRPDAARCDFGYFTPEEYDEMLEDDISELKSIDGSETGKRYYANEGSWYSEETSE